MEDKPFALIGVNTNGYSAQELKTVMDKEKLTWRSFAERRTEDGLGAIATRWNLQGTPTLYVLDHKGVIREKWLGSPGEKVIDEVLERLVKEAQK
jgi:hypothetical protein